LLKPPNKYNLELTAAIVAAERGDGTVPEALIFNNVSLSAYK